VEIRIPFERCRTYTVQVDSHAGFAVLVVDDEGDSLLEIRDMLAEDPRLSSRGACRPPEALAASEGWPPWIRFHRYQDAG
jgi:PleD family two-component response regulator